MGYVDYERIRGVDGVDIANVVANAKRVEGHKAEKRLTSYITFDDGQSLIPSVPTCFSTSIIQEVTGYPSMCLPEIAKAVPYHAIPPTLPLYHNATQLWASIPVPCAWLCPWYRGNIAPV